MKNIQIVKFTLILIFDVESPNSLSSILIIEKGNWKELKINCIHMWRLPLNDFVACAWIIRTFINGEDQSIIFMNQDLIVYQAENLWSLPYFEHILHVNCNERILLHLFTLLWIWNVVFLHVQSVHSMVL